MSGKPVKGNAVPIKPEDSIEVWRLLGSLELLPAREKIELGELIVSLIDKAKLAGARDAMVWALGRIGQRSPMYGPLNCVLPADQVSRWLPVLIQNKNASPATHLAVTQIGRRVDDRYRDLPASTRDDVIEWLTKEDVAEHYISLIKDGGNFDSEERAQAFGESLPPGLRLA